MTPKQTFIDSGHRLEHEQTTKKPSFNAACDYALLEMLQLQPLNVADPSKGWDAHSQMVGARKVLELLKTLHQVELEKNPSKQPTLNYKA